MSNIEIQLLETEIYFFLLSLFSEGHGKIFLMKHAFAHDHFDLFHECAAMYTENIRSNLES